MVSVFLMASLHVHCKSDHLRNEQNKTEHPAFNKYP